MAAKAKSAGSGTPAVKGNFISEWFGQRTYPIVHLNVAAVTGANAGQCPFLSGILKEQKECVKSASAKGVCSISSTSNNAQRQDWLVCPYRVIDSEIVKRGTARIFGLTQDVQPTPVTLLSHAGELDKFKRHVRETGTGYLFFQDKLGGEIGLLATPKSPEVAFDVTIVEMRYANGIFDVARYGILEIQTMDFHGSYGAAVGNLNNALHLHKRTFPAALQANPSWAGEKVEGPNIANVFKRTFYQMMLKFKLSAQGAAAGVVLALPRSVWDSWQKFLGAPAIEDDPTRPNTKRFRANGRPAPGSTLNAFICVFDLDSTSSSAISPVVIESFIHVSPEVLEHQAFVEVPRNMQDSLSTVNDMPGRIRERLVKWWPDLLSQGDAAQPTGRKRKK